MMQGSKKTVDDYLLTNYTVVNLVAAEQHLYSKGNFIMFTQLSEQLTNQFTTAMKSFSNTAQVETAMKPLNSLVELNTKTVEQLISQQTALITSILNDSIEQTKALSSQTDFAAAVESQRSFNEALQTKVTNSAKEAFDVVTKTSEEVTTIVKDSVKFPK